MEYVAGKLHVNPATIYRMENKAKSFRTALLVGYCELLGSIRQSFLRILQWKGSTES